MKTCCFFGTFNPIHLGHLLIAETVLDQFGFEKIAFIPSATPPHRHQDRDLASPQDRLKMVQLATEANPRFQVWDDEMNREGLSYTVDTLRHRYKALKPQERIPFIIGTDALSALGSWHQADKLTQMLWFLQIPRHVDTPASIPTLQTIQWQEHAIPIHTDLINIQPLGISSTQVRQKIKYHLSIRYWVSEPVRQFIEANQLYLGPIENGK
jgi:nicotinate-nucleotide adenylyltransferase